MATTRRTTPEWITFGISALVLVAVIVILLTELFGPNDPARPIVTVDTTAITHVGDQYQVPVEVDNDGDRVAANVQVSATLETTDGTETADQTIDFLGAEETVDLMFLFRSDPGDGDLTVIVTSFASP